MVIRQSDWCDLACILQNVDRSRFGPEQSRRKDSEWDGEVSTVPARVRFETHRGCADRHRTEHDHVTVP